VLASETKKSLFFAGRSGFFQAVKHIQAEKIGKKGLKKSFLGVDSALPKFS
jgi:hypothetical protein